MTVYYGLLGLAVVMAIVESFPIAGNRLTRKQRKVLAFLFLAIPFTVVAAFRDFTVGGDTKMYAVNWAIPEIANQTMGQILQKGRWEIGFALLCKVCLLTSNPSRILLVLSSLIIIGLTSYSILSISNYPSVAFVLLILSAQFYMDLTLMRQAIAIAICMVGLVFLRKRQNGLYIVCVCIAFLFHKSALILLIIPILMYCLRRFTAKNVIISLLALTTVLLVVPASLLNPILKSFGYANYIGTVFGMSGHISSLFWLALFCSWLIGYLYIQRVRNGSLQKENFSSDFLISISSILAGLVICVLAWKIAIFSRLYTYCISLLIPLISNEELALPKKTNLVIFVFLIWMPFLLQFLFITYLVPSWYNVIPYKFMVF